MRNSDPRVSVVSIQRHEILISTPVFTMQVTGCNFHHGSSFGLSLDPSSLVVMFHRLLEECVQRQATVLNCVKSPVSLVMKYCPFSTTLRNLASIQNLLNLSFVVMAISIRSSYSCNRKKF